MASSDLPIGVTLPQWDDIAGPAAWKRVATAAAGLGFDFVSKGDHIVFLEGESGWAVDTPTFDQYLALAYAAGATDELGVQTNITVVPYRHPVVLAKLALTMDALTEGRFTLGVGVGWYEAEFDALDVSVTERGARTDEFLSLFERACDEPVVSFDGPFHRFEGVGFHPRPAEPGGPPVLVGGNASASFRRAAEFGDGWVLPADPDGIQAGRERLMEAWADADRSGAPVVAAETRLRIDDDTEADRPLAGSPDDVIDGVQGYLDAGTTRLVLSMLEPADVGDIVDQLTRFADEVRPSFG